MRKLSVYIPIILISVSLFLGNCVYSQYNSEKISIRADNNNLEWVIEQVESQTSYRFYFNRADIDSIHITGTFSNITIPAFLEKILTNSGIRFSIDQKNKIYLSKSFIIFTALPDDYYNPKNNSVDNVLVDISVPEIKISKNKKNALNKLYEIGKPNKNNSKVTARLNGYIKDGRNGEVISGASITCDSPYTSVITDQFGYYSISLSKGTN